MNSQQDVIYGLMNELEEALDNKGFPLLGFSVVKKDTVTNFLDKLYAALPDEIKEARALLRRKDEMQYEAQQRAEKVVAMLRQKQTDCLVNQICLKLFKEKQKRLKNRLLLTVKRLNARLWMKPKISEFRQVTKLSGLKTAQIFMLNRF